MSLYKPSTTETDPKKQNRSIQGIGNAVEKAQSDIATAQSDISTLQTTVGALPATFVTSFKSRTGAITPAQGDYTSDLIPGTTTNNNATAGNIGELISSSVSSISLTTNTPKDFTSISLTAGDWDVSAGVTFNGSSNPSVTDTWASINLVTATPVNTAGQAFRTRGFTMTDPSISGVMGPVRMSLSSTTTIFMSGQATFSTGTFGVTTAILRARRVR
jgi:hypothetical protein